MSDSESAELDEIRARDATNCTIGAIHDRRTLLRMVDELRAKLAEEEQTRAYWLNSYHVVDKEFGATLARAEAAETRVRELEKAVAALEKP